MHVTPDSKPKRKGQSSLAIISPFSKTLLGTASHDADLLEGGLSKEVTDPKIVRSVASTSSWTKCWVRKTDNVFHMFAEGSDAFVMSAIKTDSTFFISQYDMFVKTGRAVVPDNTQNCCAVLKRSGRFGFRLFSTSCENCDERLGRYSCDAGEVAPAGGKPSPKCADRQLLLELSQSVLFLERAGVNARRMCVTLPVILPDGGRVVWCPRCPRGPAAGRSSLPPTHGKRAPGDGPEEAEAVKEAAKERRGPAEADAITLTNRLPKWNEDISSLTMKFLGTRVAASSSKNFLFEAALPDGVKAAMQCGKLTHGTFSLDFRFPLCPVQAFSIFLAGSAWTVDTP